MTSPDNIGLEKLIGLLRGLKEKNFWGKVEVSFKGGQPIHTELSQSIKHQITADEAHVVLILAQQPHS